MLEKLEKSHQLCVSLQQVKAQLRLDTADDDAYLEQLIQSGTTWVENHIGRSLMAQTWRLAVKLPLSYNLKCKGIKIPKTPLLALRSVICIPKDRRHRHNMMKDTTLQEEGDHTLLFVKRWPNEGEGIMEIIFTAGYGERPDDVPADIRQAILNHVTCLYEHRTGIARKDLLGIYDLLHPYRIMRLP
jgi:uncharacterized phiE125 gp8 family phage protein